MRTICRLVLCTAIAVSVQPHSVSAGGPAVCDLTTNLDPNIEWEVASVADLQILETDAVDCSNKTIYQTADIDLNSLNSPVSSWYGTFNGNGFKFTDSDTTGSDLSPEESLFDFPGGDLVLNNIIRHGDISVGQPDVGAFVGMTADSVTITNSYTTGNVDGDFHVGGFVGRADGTVTITNSYTTGDITARFFYAGGFVGRADGTVTITNSYTTGNVEGDDTIGGFVGRAGGTVTITNSYTTGNNTARFLSVGGFVGRAEGAVTITNSYTTGNVQGDIEVGGFVGSLRGGATVTNSYTTSSLGALIAGGFFGGPGGEVTVSASFCLDTNVDCGPSGWSGVPASSTDLTSTSFLRDTNLWDFSTVWCIRSGVNGGYPVLRSIDFGPGNTECWRNDIVIEFFRVTLDPALGECGAKTSPWTVVYVGVLTLPTDCQRDGYVFQGWTRDTTSSEPELLLTTVVSDSTTLTAVWAALPEAPTVFETLVNFLCTTNCDSALFVWLANSTPTVTAVISIDTNDVSCAFQGQLNALHWCWISGLTPQSTHSVSIAWQNQYGTGPSTSSSFTLN